MNKITIFIPITRKELFKKCVECLKVAKVENKCSVLISINNPKIKIDDIKKILSKKFQNLNFFKIYKTNKFLKVDDSWEAGIRRINSEWTMMLCEDDMILHNSIDILEHHLNKYKNIDCFTWPINNIIFDHDKNLFRYHKNFKNYDMKSKILNSKNVFTKIKNENYINKIKNTSPFFPKVLIKTKLIQQPSKFFFSSEPMWSSLFQILSKTKKYVYINYPIFIMGYLKNSSSEMHNKEDIKKFSKGYNSKIIRVKKFFPELDEYIFILSNRLIFLEVLLHAKNKFGFDFKIKKEKIIKSVKDEFIERSIDSKHSYLDEVNKINKSKLSILRINFIRIYINYLKIVNKLRYIFNFTYTKNYNDIRSILKF